ncbi:XRE family transcriptional regulator [Hymenobacter sediminis]|uniref:helix-turn-helix domain-containing protein n=1 Tax=Hymenobacter sediminis TaxID=2218621 RepID=UPI000DA6BCEB|nr:helix-turn-helix transcriptional regulator [Hymenobacter sediminis]RPD43658.1 XRE family transcriptional regulator [Hymenobacter sediminis]
MASKYFGKIEIAPEARQFVERSFLIADQIKHLLRSRGLTQRGLADLLGKKEPEISRMLSGTHNFTLKTIIRLEQALQARLFTTPYEVQTNATALTLHDTVANDEVVVADWKPVKMFPNKGRSKKEVSDQTASTQKAAEESAAFFAEEGVISFC